MNPNPYEPPIVAELVEKPRPRAERKRRAQEQFYGMLAVLVLLGMAWLAIFALAVSVGWLYDATVWTVICLVLAAMTIYRGLRMAGG